LTADLAALAAVDMRHMQTLQHQQMHQHKIQQARLMVLLCRCQ